MKIEPVTNLPDDGRTQGREGNHLTNEPAIGTVNATVDPIIPLLNGTKPSLNDGAQYFLSQGFKRSAKCGLPIWHRGPELCHAAFPVS